MRRLSFIIFGLFILLLMIGAVVFGLKTPEMPVREVHKVISVKKIHPDVKVPSVPAVPEVPPVIIPYKGSQNASPNVPASASPADVLPPSLPQPGTVPGNAAGNAVTAPPAQP